MLVKLWWISSCTSFLTTWLHVSILTDHLQVFPLQMEAGTRCYKAAIWAATEMYHLLEVPPLYIYDVSSFWCFPIVCLWCIIFLKLYHLLEVSPLYIYDVSSDLSSPMLYLWCIICLKFPHCMFMVYHLLEVSPIVCLWCNIRSKFSIVSLWWPW